MVAEVSVAAWLALGADEPHLLCPRRIGARFARAEQKRLRTLPLPCFV
jgi:hypothetical protein